MRLFILSGIFILLVGCAGPIDQVPADVQPYVDRFRADAKAQGATLFDQGGLIVTMEKPTADADAVGYCYWVQGAPGQMQIDPDFWAQAIDVEKEELIYHELGHCFLHLKHSSGTLSDGGPAHIMDASPPYIQDYQADRNKFVLDLFHER